MNDLNVSRPSPNRIDTGPASAAPAAPGPRVDTGPVESPGPPPGTAPALPPGPPRVDHGQTGAAMRAMADNVAVDFGAVAALLMQIDSELARAARDSQVAEIESVAHEMHASADDIRESATLALAGGVVSGATQIASAGISLGGGIKGMRLTSSSAALEPGGLGAEPTTAPESPSATASAPSVGPAAAPEEGPGTAAESRTSADEAARDSSRARRTMATRRLDHTLSQQLSARSQNVALMTDGLAKLSSSTGEMIKSVLDYEARQKDADGKEADARADEKRAYLERTKGFADSMQKGAQDMLQLFGQLEDSVQQTNRAVWSRA